MTTVFQRGVRHCLSPELRKVAVNVEVKRKVAGNVEVN
jgi:hypothetical protein